MAKFTNDTTLLIQGIKVKFDEQGNLADIQTLNQLENLVKALIKMMTTK